MTARVTAPDLLEELADLRRRVQDLERTTSNVTQGQTFTDPQGRVRVRIGPMGDGTHGVKVYNAAGAVVFSQTA